MAKKYVTAYIPTVNGEPARFCNDYQLCTSGGRGWYVVPVFSLRDVRRQIAVSRLHRARDNYSPSTYNYVRVRIPVKA